MSYPVIPSRRMAYDIDGTEVGRSFGVLSSGFSAWLNPAQKAHLNSITGSSLFDSRYMSFWFWFPEAREVTHGLVNLIYSAGSGVTPVCQGSNDTANGVDGTWESAVLSSRLDNTSFALGYWRNVRDISFAEPKRVIRFQLDSGNHAWKGYIRSAHFYGAKAAGQTPDDILIMENTTDEFGALKDWGNRPEGTVEFSSFRLKNASTTKTANAINVQLNHSDFLLSWSDTGPWVTFVDIASLSPGAVSSPIYVKNQLAPPLLTLGPKAARVIVGVGSWS